MQLSIGFATVYVVLGTGGAIAAPNFQLKKCPYRGSDGKSGCRTSARPGDRRKCPDGFYVQEKRAPRGSPIITIHHCHHLVIQGV